MGNIERDPLEFVVCKSGNENKYEGQKHSIHLWKYDERSLSEPLWESAPIPISLESICMHEEPLVSADELFGISIGLNIGAVHRIRIYPKEKQEVATFPSRFFDYNSMRDSDRGNVEHEVMATGLRHVTGLAYFDNGRYDSSYAGLYMASSPADRGKLIDNRRISSMCTVNNQLCIVPLPSEFTRESYEETKTGSLVDAMTKEVIFENLTPFDGSGMRQATYFIHGDRLYLQHGNTPLMMSVKEFPSGKNITSYMADHDYTGFIAHQGEVYDVRRDQKREGIFLSMHDSNEDPVFRPPRDRYITSISSAGNKGIIASVYGSDENNTLFISHLQPEKPLAQIEGRAKIMQRREYSLRD